MIVIEERKSKALPNSTSLFFNIEYNKEILSALEQQEIKYYDKKNKE